VDKKYQVFVSSTYKDLVEERKEVIQALLELDCIPVGMELFPAADDDQWTLIKNLIDDCDYYILIVGGRYGSLNKDGISYTQMEYEYALENEIPVISFLHQNRDELPVSKTDKNSEKAIKLNLFLDLVQKKMCKYWSTSKELGSVVSRSLVKLIKTKPRNGWVRADKISSDEANLTILELNRKIAKLEKNLISEEQTKNLSQGEDKISLSVQYKEFYKDEWNDEKVQITWDTIFSKCCTVLIDEGSETEFYNVFKQLVTIYLKKKIELDDFYNINVFKDSFFSVIIQFKALGLIEKSQKKRSIKDNKTYWKLTIKGDEYLTNLRAIKKEKTDANLA